MISDYSRNPEYMREKLLNLKQTQAIQELQQYIRIHFCRKRTGKTIPLPKRRKETTASFPEKESMWNTLSDLSNAFVSYQNDIETEERDSLSGFLCLLVFVTSICLLNFARDLLRIAFRISGREKCIGKISVNLRLTSPHCFSVGLQRNV